MLKAQLLLLLIAGSQCGKDLVLDMLLASMVFALQDVFLTILKTMFTYVGYFVFS